MTNWPKPTHDSITALKARKEDFWYNSYCLRCGFPWTVVKSHPTKYVEYASCFPLCQPCWELLGGPEARIEYYKMLIDFWRSDLLGPIDEETARLIQRAVANGG
jgi:hypothetical protein